MPDDPPDTEGSDRQKPEAHDWAEGFANRGRAEGLYREKRDVPHKSLVELRAACMPDAARAVSGHPPS
jgi:hypothetical protein